VTTASDPLNCGGCGSICADPRTCTGGACSSPDGDGGIDAQ
jgi:hypothetical protein